MRNCEHSETSLHRAYVSLGSNLGDRWGFLRQAVFALARTGEIRVSSVYETDPVDYLDQPRFLNMVAEMWTTESASALLERLLTIEARHGRTRDIRFGPRTLDLDLLLYDDAYLCFRHLQVPHPRMWQRGFVLVPLAELAPKRRGLGGETITEMAARASRQGGIRCVGRLF
ncbi:hypothetical protein GCM10025857_18600 [Alicyclobacillus contaminans]|uniref:2-amino-4-hydroxy-6- hydroxymethyldihydropteridine diphosphokinase n=1 Tax=Alicyclobacillus contaminans TaxID=392016 RepID=UPI0003FEAD02|nr:2-amino-4-hydroxy-6-hydroxymethyldihydropteridine diphosphokinase [Alicyclobacillus contaminans]GMA50503.1 hypothetical protein GCM10025857_18600 [Alicyclobacillus contaminans]